MSLCTVDQVLDRITKATEHSKLVVLRSVHKGRFECVFERTYLTRQLLKNSPAHLIGIFCQDDDRDNVKLTLRRSMRA